MDRDARLLAIAGVVLLALSLLNGFAVHVIAQSRQALSAHLVGLIGAGLLIALASLWPRLNLRSRGSTAGALLAVYGFCVGWLINFLAALTGRYGIFPLSVGSAPGHGAQDLLVSLALLSVALALLALCALLLGALVRRAR